MFSDPRLLTCASVLQESSNELDKTGPLDTSVKSDQSTSEKKQTKGVKYRTWSPNNIPPPSQKYKKPTEKEITEVFSFSTAVIFLQRTESALLIRTAGVGGVSEIL